LTQSALEQVKSAIALLLIKSGVLFKNSNVRLVIFVHQTCIKKRHDEKLYGKAL
jgi:hypothetical protein